MNHEHEASLNDSSFVSDAVSKILGYLPSVGIAVTVSTFVTLFLIGATSQEREILTIDAKQVVHAFIEGRGVAMTEEEMSRAILQFDALVMAEAKQIYEETGAIIVNGNHMLAGGRDVSAPFAKRVIATWDSFSAGEKKP